MKWLKSKEAIIKELSPAEHDRMMVPIQGNPQIGAILSALTMQSMGLTMEGAFDLASPVYMIKLGVIGRVLYQPDLYVDILSHNLQMADMLELMQKHLARISKAVLAGDIAELDAIYGQAVEFVGQDNIGKSFELFQRLSRFIADLSKDHAITIQVREDRPGVLLELLTVFAQHNINLTACHSFPVGDGSGNHNFMIGLSQSVLSGPVINALDEIRGLEMVERVF